MPTRYRRIAVPLDAELDSALRSTTEQLRTKSAAARVHELALIGARALGAEDARVEQTRRELLELGATAATGDLLAVARRVRAAARRQAGETSADTLDWVRGRPGVE